MIRTKAELTALGFTIVPAPAPFVDCTEISCSLQFWFYREHVKASELFNHEIGMQAPEFKDGKFRITIACHYGANISIPFHFISEKQRQELLIAWSYQMEAKRAMEDAVRRHADRVDAFNNLFNQF